jgi:hypothetical protein
VPARENRVEPGVWQLPGREFLQAGALGGVPSTTGC